MHGNTSWYSLHFIQLTAYHEGGHAIVAYNTEGAHPIHKATILPRGSALGMVTQLPSSDETSVSKKQLLARLDVCMGGRVAEELIFGQDHVTTGASSDLQTATELAHYMVWFFIYLLLFFNLNALNNLYLTGTGDHFQYYMKPIIIVLNVVKVGSCSILIVFILHFIVLSIPSDIPMGYGNKKKSKYCDLDCYICPQHENYSFQLLNAVYFFPLQGIKLWDEWCNWASSHQRPAKFRNAITYWCWSTFFGIWGSCDLTMMFVYS